MKQISFLSRRESWTSSLPFIALCMGGGFLSSFIGGAFKKQPWYDDSAKPAGIWPPQWVFPMVWIPNYICMGLASWQVWKQKERTKTRLPLILFAMHLIHNFSFIPIVYSIKKKSVYVFMDSLGLFSGIITAIFFARVSRLAGWFMLPYTGWLGFTTFIKALWWRMDRER